MNIFRDGLNFLRIQEQTDFFELEFTIKFKSNLRMNAVKFSSTSNNKRAYAKRKATQKKAEVKSQSLRKMVKYEALRVIRSQAETKQAFAKYSFACYNLQGTSPASCMTNHYMALSPNNQVTNPLQVVPGVSPDTRVGNSVTTKKGWFTYIVTQNPYNAVTNVQPQPYIIRFWIYENRSTPGSAPTDNDFTDPASADFFKEGSAVSGFSGQTVDLTKNVNNEAYKYCMHFDVKCGFAQSYPNGTNPNLEYFSNNDFPLTAYGKVDITRFLRKKYTFNNDLDQDVKTPTLFVVWNCYPAVGTTVATTQLPISVDVSATYEYIDL